MSYTGSGKIFVSGCSPVETIFIYNTLYNIGDVLYDLKRSKYGYIESVAIKKVNITGDNGSRIYIDTFNRSWNEYDLCIESVAKNNAIVYWTAYNNRTC